LKATSFGLAHSDLRTGDVIAKIFTCTRPILLAHIGGCSVLAIVTCQRGIHSSTLSPRAFGARVALIFWVTHDAGAKISSSTAAFAVTHVKSSFGVVVIAQCARRHWFKGNAFASLARRVWSHETLRCIADDIFARVLPNARLVEARVVECAAVPIVARSPPVSSRTERGTLAYATATNINGGRITVCAVGTVIKSVPCNARAVHFLAGGSRSTLGGRIASDSSAHVDPGALALQAAISDCSIVAIVARRAVGHKHCASGGDALALGTDELRVARRLAGACHVCAQVPTNAHTAIASVTNCVLIAVVASGSIIFRFCGARSQRAIQLDLARHIWAFDLRTEISPDAHACHALIVDRLVGVVVARGSVGLGEAVDALASVIVTGRCEVALAYGTATFDARTQRRPLTDASSANIVFGHRILVVARGPILCIGIRAFSL
jgi:hypothetical protein